MSKFDQFIDANVEAIDAKLVETTSVWKDRIINYLMDNQGASSKQVLEATDHKYDGTNYTKRKHCLDSQITYARQDENLVIKHNDDKYVLVGVIKDKMMHTFASAAEYMSK